MNWINLRAVYVNGSSVNLAFDHGNVLLSVVVAFKHNGIRHVRESYRHYSRTTSNHIRQFYGMATTVYDDDETFFRELAACM